MDKFVLIFIPILDIFLKHSKNPKGYLAHLFKKHVFVYKEQIL